MEPDSNQLLKDLTLKSVAGDSRVATPSGEKPISVLEAGNLVWAFSTKFDSGKLELSSSEAKVTFINGTPSSSIDRNIVYVQFGDSGGMICTLEQPFLLINGKYIRGSQLRPGQQLVDEKGNPVVVEMVSVGEYHGSIYNIGVGDSKFDGPNGHLLLVQGVIVGDYIFQLYFDSLPDNLKE